MGGVSETIGDLTACLYSDNMILEALNKFIIICPEEDVIKNSKRFNIEPVANKFHLMMSYA